MALASLHTRYTTIAINDPACSGCDDLTGSPFLMIHLLWDGPLGILQYRPEEVPPNPIISKCFVESMQLIYL